MTRFRGITAGKGRSGIIAALVFAAVSSPAFADVGPLTAYYNEPAYGPPSVQFKLDVLASVGGRCGFAPGLAPGGTIDAHDLEAGPWSGDATFTPQCTARWTIAVTSLNGALKSTTPATGLTGFTDLAPYTVSLHVLQDSGGAVDANCPVGQLLAAGASACSFRGTASATNGLLLTRSTNQTGSYIRASGTAYTGLPRLVAGTYGDTLTITISPAP